MEVDKTLKTKKKRTQPNFIALIILNSTLFGICDSWHALNRTLNTIQHARYQGLAATRSTARFCQPRPIHVTQQGTHHRVAAVFSTEPLRKNHHFLIPGPRLQPSFRHVAHMKNGQIFHGSKASAKLAPCRSGRQATKTGEEIFTFFTFISSALTRGALGGVKIYSRHHVVVR